MKNKLISIVIICYNGEKYLSETLNSILNQKYKNYEVIFIDNCSVDSSEKIYKKIKDKRFRYFKIKKKVKLYNQHAHVTCTTRPATAYTANRIVPIVRVHTT